MARLLTLVLVAPALAGCESLGNFWGPKDDPVLDEPAYLLLLQQSRNVRAYTYRAVAMGLFDRVLMHNLPAGPGPSVNGPGGAIRPVGGK